MFQVDHEINSYNSLIMNQTNKNNQKFNKTYSSSKLVNSKEISSSKNKNQLLSDKKAVHNANLNCFNTDNTLNKNLKNISKKQTEDKDSSSKNVKKLPKILKYTIQTNSLLDSKCDNSSNVNGGAISISNPTDKTMKENNNNNEENDHSQRNLLLKKEFKEKISIQIDRKGSLKLSDSKNLESMKKILMPVESIKTKKIKSKKEINFGKMKEYIKLPEFIGDEPLTEIIFNPIIDDNLTKPQNEKQYEINLYLNSHKMLSNLVYLKTPLNKDGTIPIQNIINVKKLKAENNKSEAEDEEEIIPETNKEKSEPAPPADADEQLKLIIPKKRFISISEYPGNYNKPEKVPTNERQIRFSQDIESGITSGYDNLDKLYQQESNNKIINNINNIQNEYFKKKTNNSEIYIDKLKDNSFNDNINIKERRASKFTNNLSKNIEDDNNNDINSEENDGVNENDKEIQLNTIYGEILPYYKLKDEKDKTLIFESRFESGNLLCAFRTDEPNKYQLFLQNDTNTTGYIQWFFFRVSNTQKGRKVNFNIINMLRPKCLYKKGLKIMTYSKLQAQNENIGWHRDCENIMYYTNNLFIYNENSKKKRSLSSLSFDYEFKYDDDKVYFANCLPYFYSKLIDEMEAYEKKLKNQFFFFKTIPFTQTLGGNDLILININSNINNNINSMSSDFSLPQLNKSFNHSFMNLLNSSNSFKLKQKELQKSKNKKSVFMIGRQHPGETVGSHVIKGCIDFLLGDSDEAKKLRDIYDFQIVPMMNPDGVIVGNSRTGFAGCDLNRRWTKPNEVIHPEIYYTKNLILKTATNQNISFVIDFHGHFGAYNSLFYCNHKENKKRCSLYPFVCSKLSNIISFQQSTFTMPKYKASTERLSLFRELEDCDNDNIIALETSFFGTYKNNKEEKNYYFNTELLNEIGRDVCLGMLSYYLKCESISIENILNNENEWEGMKNLDVDMRDFEAELIKEVNEEEEEDKDDLSESEPSIDNFDKKEILKLMPVVAQKKKKKKGKNLNNGSHNNYKIKKIEKYLTRRKYGGNNEKNNFDKNKNIDLDIELYNPLKELRSKKIEDENKKKIKQNKNTPIKFTSNFQLTKKPTIKPIRQIHTSNQSQPPQIQRSTEEPKTKDESTQTDEVFFRMHWTFFVGKYKILNCKRNYNNLPSISNAPFNMTKLNKNLFGRFFNKRNNFILINERFKKSDWTKFGNTNQIDQNKKQNWNFNVMSNFKNFNFKDKNVKPIYLNKINKNSFPVNRNLSNQK